MSATKLRARVLSWATRLRVQPSVIRIAPMSRKWGSCSTRGIVTFARDLAAQAPEFQDFVIVHELLHLRVRNHGRLFKALMTLYVPNWRAMDAAK